jgi:hypothetical protein
MTRSRRKKRAGEFFVEQSGRLAHRRRIARADPRRGDLEKAFASTRKALREYGFSDADIARFLGENDDPKRSARTSDRSYTAAGGTL